MPVSQTIVYNDVNALVQDYVAPTIEKQIFTSTAFLYRAQKNIKWFTGGRQIRHNLAWRDPQSGGWFSGNDVLDTTKRDLLDAATFTPKNAHANITLYWEDEQAVKGPEMMQSLMETQSEIAEESMRRTIDGDLYNDGSNVKAIGGLRHALRAFTGTAPGVLPANTYGGITRQGRYDGSGGGTQTNTWWIHNGDNTAYDTAAAAGATCFNPTVQLAIAGVLGKIWAQIGINSSKRPSMILSNWGAYTAYHNSLLLNDRSIHPPQQNNDLARMGFEHVMYKNAAWVVDEQAPRTSAKIEQIYFINEKTVRLYVDKAANFTWTGFRTPHNQMLKVGYLLWRGEICIVEPRANGVISSVDTSSVS